LYAVSPLIYNVGIILGLLFLYPYFGLIGLSLGVILGAVGHLAIQIPYISKSKLRPHPTRKFNPKELFKVLRTSIARAVTLSLHQLVLLVLVGFASVMAVGSVSVFQFAYNLQSVPLAIIGVSYSVAAFPLLAQLFAEKKFTVFGKNIATTFKHILFWSLPATALFIVIRAQFVRVVLGSGEFDWSDTRLTAAILAIFIISLSAQAINLLIVRGLYAVGNSRIPFFVTLATSSLALFFSFFFYTQLVENTAFYSFIESTMRLENVSGIEVLALPLGYSCALILHSIIILIVARKYLFVSLRSLALPASQSLAAAFIGGYISYLSLNFFDNWLEDDTLISVFLQGLLAFAFGLFGYLLFQHIFRNKELKEITKTLKHKLGKGQVVVPQDEDNLAI